MLALKIIGSVLGLGVIGFVGYNAFGVITGFLDNLNAVLSYIPYILVAIVIFYIIRWYLRNRTSFIESSARRNESKMRLKKSKDEIRTYKTPEQKKRDEEYEERKRNRDEWERASVEEWTKRGTTKDYNEKVERNEAKLRYERSKDNLNRYNNKEKKK